jgi:HK97 family phage prohead protease
VTTNPRSRGGGATDPLLPYTVTRIAATKAEGVTLSGYAAIFDSPNAAGTQQIARGAFDGALGGDVLALLNHDPGQILGRTSSGTLRLSTDGRGLWCEIDLPATETGHDIRTLVERGDLTGLSFSAVPGQIERAKGGVIHRSFKSLTEISLVPFPSYSGARVTGARATGADSQRLAALTRGVRLRHAALVATGDGAP